MKRRRCSDKLVHDAHDWPNPAAHLAYAGLKGESCKPTQGRAVIRDYWCPGVQNIEEGS